MSYLLGNFITKEGLENIKIHVYKSNGYSAIEYKLEPFWNWLVEQLPRVSSLILDSRSKCSHVDWKYSSRAIVCVHDVLWLIVYKFSSFLDYHWRNHWNFYVPNFRRNWWKISLKNWLMLSLRVVNGSWMRLPLFLGMRFSHDLGRPFWKWNIRIHSS